MTKARTNSTTTIAASVDSKQAMQRRTPDAYTPENPPAFDRWSTVYALRCFGNCCEPEIPDGSSVIIDQQARYKAGDFVAIWSLTKAGHIEAMVKRLVVDLAPWTRFPHVARPDDALVPALIVEALNPPRCFDIDTSTVYALHRSIGFAPPRPGVPLGTMVPDATIQWFDRPSVTTPSRRGVKRGAHG